MECAGGYAPLRHKFYADGTIKSEMTLGCCRLCKYRNRCFNRKELEKQELDAAKAAAKGSTPYFKTTWMRTNANKYMRASQQPDRNTRSFKDCSAYRNGIEAGVSTLKNGYDVIHMPPAGRIKRTMLFGLKVMAFNVSRCIHYLMRIRKAAAA